ncbi:MAG: hypothetical protein K5872_19275 [Rhizobiaceae bacterium]|nr:hypothetical protein [Rhizobiaceae bacterium]MCV0408364.1 hypothetical protein [Rhizobiaceae bacterium]
MTKKVNEEKARQGRWGFNVLAVLVVGLLLAMIVWFGAEMFGQSTETPRTESGVETIEPADTDANPGG